MIIYIKPGCFSSSFNGQLVSISIFYYCNKSINSLRKAQVLTGGKSLESTTMTSHTFTVLLMFNLLKPILCHRHVSSRCSAVTLKFQTQPWTDNWTFKVMIITAEHGDIWDTWLGLETWRRQRKISSWYVIFLLFPSHRQHVNCWTSGLMNI